MSTEAREELLAYYRGELDYLRTMGAEFARDHRDIAGRLGLSAHGASDPHVERLIESFAFLTARIRRSLDSAQPRISTELLQLVHPHFATPTPSASIARFDIDPKQGKITTGHRIPRETPVFATAGEVTCRFRTCYPVTLWPFHVGHAAIEPSDQFDLGNASCAAVLRIRIECADDLRALELDTLRLYLDGDPRTIAELYRLLFAGERRVAVRSDGNPELSWLAAQALAPVGFGADEVVLPDAPSAHPGFRLLHEYFTMPQKYHFADLRGLQGCFAGRWADLLILLDETPTPGVAVTSKTFVLGCTPIVNLFPKVVEPIRVTHRQVEYRLLPDVRWERTTEIHSIQGVAAGADGAPAGTVQPFFSYRHDSGAGGPGIFWHARREPSRRSDLPGHDVYLSFVDHTGGTAFPQERTVIVKTLCTNRQLAEHLQAGTELQHELEGPVQRITCLFRPTRQLEPPTTGSAQWRLVSHLSLNQISLLDGTQGLPALREILRLYSSSDPVAAEQQIRGLTGMTSRPVVRRVGVEAWRGFCHGTEVALQFDAFAHSAMAYFLFASVLHRFLASYVSINSFVQLRAASTQREGIWYEWPPMTGQQTVL
ncbi:MAG: type VI secretion system baseplate subunit TssF [Gemmatimonadales bacterium]|nr:type VI secretion system baseplate subunit TssF [Gemmatimonadales bacterium]